MLILVKNARMIWMVIALLAFGLLGVEDLTAREAGVVVGTVADNDGGPLPGARVEIAGPGRTHSEKSGGMGFFLFAGLAAGEYTVTVSHPEFSSVAQKVLVRPGETTTMSVQLRGGRRMSAGSGPALGRFKLN
jgi:hypothetical protein